MGRGLPFAAAVLIAVGVPSSASADEGPVPGSCRPHPTHVANPGCVPALIDTVAGAIDDALAYEYTLPNLVPDITDVYVERTGVLDPGTGTVVPGESRVHFDTLTQNLGTVPFDLASDDPTAPEATVSQCTAWTAGSVCRERRTVPGLVASTAQRRIRWEHQAHYELRRLLADGSPDWSDAGLVGTNEATSNCLVDNRRRRPDALPVPTYLFCDGVREGVSSGWANMYGAEVVGQQIALGDIDDGLYALVVILDPLIQVLESDRTDNRVAVTVELTVDGGISRIVSRSWS